MLFTAVGVMSFPATTAALSGVACEVLSAVVIPVHA